MLFAVNQPGKMTDSDMFASHKCQCNFQILLPFCVSFHRFHNLHSYHVNQMHRTFFFVHFSLLMNLETNPTSLLIPIHRSLVLPTVSWATDRSHQRAMDARTIRTQIKLSFAFLHSIRPTVRVHRDTQNHCKIRWI